MRLKYYFGCFAKEVFLDEININWGTFSFLVCIAREHVQPSMLGGWEIQGTESRHPITPG